MKQFLPLLFFFVFLSINLAAQETPKSTEEILKTAYAKAAKEKKNVFVIFHASWCVWCRKMDTSMSDQSVKPFFDKSYVIEHLVVDEPPNKKHLENPGAAELLTKHGGNNQGIPFWLVFDAKGNLLADSQITPGKNSGCPATKEEVDHFINVLKKTSSITPEQIVAVEARFRKNEQR
jgi:thioredoxin-related protein